MRSLALSLLLLALPTIAAPADDSATCTIRHAELSKQAAAL